jgi:hypothetical protein
LGVVGFLIVLMLSFIAPVTSKVAQGAVSCGTPLAPRSVLSREIAYQHVGVCRSALSERRVLGAGLGVLAGAAIGTAAYARRYDKSADAASPPSR